jgi:hypothetical protein
MLILYHLMEWLFGSVCRKQLDHIFFWNRSGLERKLAAHQDYYKVHLVYSALSCNTPVDDAGLSVPIKANLQEIRLAISALKAPFVLKNHAGRNQCQRMAGVHASLSARVDNSASYSRNSLSYLSGSRNQYRPQSDE